MPTKHIPETTWRKIEKEMVKYVSETQRPIKDTEVLNILVLRGLEVIKIEEYERLKKAK